jgi:hypothetical protein
VSVMLILGKIKCRLETNSSIWTELVSNF